MKKGTQENVLALLASTPFQEALTVLPTFVPLVTDVTIKDRPVLVGKGQNNEKVQTKVPDGLLGRYYGPVSVTVTKNRNYL